MTKEYTNSTKTFERSEPPLDALNSNELKEVYIWGIELIQGLKTYSIQRLTLSEEITYYQRKAFSKFVEEVYTLSTTSNNKC